MAFSSDRIEPADDITLTIAHDLATLATAAARSVAPYLRQHYGNSQKVTQKTSAHDPVTEHDQRVEEALQTILGYLAPGSRLLGEETGERDLSAILPVHNATFSRLFPLPTTPSLQGARRRCITLGNRVRWIVDPIDGTANFASGFPYFNTSIGVELDGSIVAGVVSAPITEEAYVADLQSAWMEHNGKVYPLVSKGARREIDALLLTYFPTLSALKAHPEAMIQKEIQLLEAYQTIRRPGAAALDLAYVAAGRASAFFATFMKPWDLAAGIHLVKMAGGIVYNLPLGTDLPEGIRPGVLACVGTLKPITAYEILTEIDDEMIRLSHK